MKPVEAQNIPQPLGRTPQGVRGLKRKTNRQHPALEIIKLVQHNILHPALLLIQLRSTDKTELLELARQTGLDHAETFQAGRSLLNLLLPLVIVSLLIKIGDG